MLVTDLESLAGKQDRSAFFSLNRVYFCIGKIGVFRSEFPEILHGSADPAFFIKFKSIFLLFTGAEFDLSDKIDVLNALQ